jgi:hypothetical protein
MITILDGTEAAPRGKSATHTHLYGPLEDSEPG